AELDALMASAPVGFAIFDREGRHLYLNKRLTEIGGASAEAYIGRTPREVVPHVAPWIEAGLAHVLATGEAVPNVAELSGTPMPHGGDGHAHIAGLYPIRDAAGAITSVGLVSSDLTEYRRVEQALHASEARLRRLWESNILGILYASADGRIQDANDA